MQNKRWTPQTEITETLLLARNKRKWQIALRRYVLEKNKSTYYARFFGIGIELFRGWIEIQFDSEMHWDNFGTNWQIDHIIPISYFDFKSEEDMEICWNFLNIQVSSTTDKGAKIDLLGAKDYFSQLLAKTQIKSIEKMVKKIEAIERNNRAKYQIKEEFILINKNYLDDIQGFTSYEYNRLNEGVLMEEIHAEKEIVKKYGS